MVQDQAKVQETRKSRAIQTHVVQPVRHQRRGKVHPTGKDHCRRVTGSICRRQSSRFPHQDGHQHPVTSRSHGKHQSNRVLSTPVQPGCYNRMEKHELGAKQIRLLLETGNLRSSVAIDVVGSVNCTVESSSEDKCPVSRVD